MQLFREVGLLAATLLVIGNIIGIGIFTTSGLIAAEVGNSPWLLGVWLVGGMLALIGAICYSLLSVRIPDPEENTPSFIHPTVLSPLFCPAGPPSDHRIFCAHRRFSAEACHLPGPVSSGVGFRKCCRSKVQRRADHHGH